MVAPASSVFILGHDGRRQLPWPICIIPPQTDDGRVRVMDIRAAIARELKTHHFSLHDISTNNSLLSGLSASEGTEPIVDERIYTDGLPEPLKTLDMVSSHAVLIGCLSIPPPAPLVPLPLTAPREDQSILELANLSSSVDRLPTPEPSEVPRQFRNSSATPPREPAGELERPVLRLPPEILHLIFLRATAPALLLSPDDLRPQSAWNLNLRTQLRLISVCRDWNDAGVTLLYENIAIHSIGQLCALIATLRDNSYLSERVHSLCFACIVPDVPTNYQAMFERIADTLPILCPNLVNLSLRIPCPNKGAASSICSHFGSLLLTHLEVTDALPFGAVMDNIYLFAPRLTHLSLCSNTKLLPEHKLPIGTAENPLIFPLLHSFQCQLNYDLTKLITDCWDFPVLKELVSAPPDFYPPIRPEQLSHRLTFIQKHGKRVETLLFHYVLPMNDWSTFDSDGSSVQLVIESLSHLRHLVIPLFLTVAAPQVRTLDCFISEKNYHELKGENANRITGGDILPLLSEEVRKNCFPNLQSFRLIERGLLELPFIHSLLPRFNSDEYRFQFPGVDIRASPSALWGWSTGDIRCISPAADDLSDSSSGTDYLWEPSSESESEDDDEESEDDGEDESEGSLLWDYDPTDATIGDEETALEAWRTSRRVDHGASDIESDSEIESENEA